MGNAGNYIHLLVVLLIVGSSLLSWIFKKVQEQRARKQITDEIERRKIELLRTGRDPGAEMDRVARDPNAINPVPPPIDPEVERREELARRRREQVEELRRRAAQRQQGPNAPTPMQTRGPAPAQVQRPTAAPGVQREVVIQLPGGRVLRIPAPAEAPVESRPEQRPSTPRPPRQPSKKPATKQVSRQANKPTSSRAAGALAASGDADTGESTTQRLIETQAAAAYDLPNDRARTPVGQVAPVIAGAPMTPEQWRRALIASELLSKPMSLRTPGQSADPLAGPQ